MAFKTELHDYLTAKEAVKIIKSFDSNIHQHNEVLDEY